MKARTGTRNGTVLILLTLNFADSPFKNKCAVKRTRYFGRPVVVVLRDGYCAAEKFHRADGDTIESLILGRSVSR